jgi:hypothetical protein
MCCGNKCTQESDKGGKGNDNGLPPLGFFFKFVYKNAITPNILTICPKTLTPGMLAKM